MSSSFFSKNTGALMKSFKGKNFQAKVSAPQFSDSVQTETRLPPKCPSSCSSGSYDSRELVFLSALFDSFYDQTVLDIRRSKRYKLESAISVIGITLIDLPSFSLSPQDGNDSANSSTETFVDSRIVSLSDLTFVHLLGNGAFGQVYEVTDNVSKCRLALKVISKTAMKEEWEVTNVLNEQAVLRLLAGSPWHLTIEASWSDSAAFYMLMPVYPTDLESLLHLHGHFVKEAVIFYMAEIILALNHLHCLGFAHRDVKAPNILIDQEGHIVLGDFGLAKDYGRRPTFEEFTVLPFWPFHPNETGAMMRHPSELTFATQERCGSLLESPPEAFEDSWHCFGADRWGAGTVGYRMLTGRHPWYAETLGETVRMIRFDPLEFYPEDDVDAITEDFFQAMLMKDPEDRLQVGDATANHPFFHNLDWQLLGERAIPVPWAPGSQTSHVVFNVPPMFPAGTPYTPEEDPHPEFVFTSPRLQVQVQEPEHEPEHEQRPEEGRQDEFDSDQGADDCHDETPPLPSLPYVPSPSPNSLAKGFRTQEALLPLPTVFVRVEAEPDVWEDIDLGDEPTLVTGPSKDFFMEKDDALGDFTLDCAQEDIILADTTLDDTMLDDTMLDDTILEDTTLDDTTLEDTTLDDTTLEDTTLDDTTLDDTTLDNTTLDDTTPDDTTLDDTTIEHIALDDTTQEDTTLDNTTLDDTTLDDTIQEDITLDDIIPTLDDTLPTTKEKDSFIIVASPVTVKPGLFTRFVSFVNKLTTPQTRRLSDEERRVDFID
ncbi:hypothetical protein D9615_004894 [Tricholomella constricta]|uniref:Protein kinase domain-containing protein n=1 Tax=Tricholomella constricta TaxID=117010 RepID=A0A8H5HGU7_9AGAR|nr:hypothetical protein D9615_004894 [Tricholomella constricta]